MQDEHNYAGFWVRAAANLLDLLLLCLAAIGVFYLFHGCDGLAFYFSKFVAFSASNLLSVATDVWHVAISSPAFFILFLLPMRTTPGKILLKLTIVDAITGQKVSRSQIIARSLPMIFIWIVTYGLGFVSAAFDAKKQGWHDKYAGTIVVHVKNSSGS